MAKYNRSSMKVRPVFRKATLVHISPIPTEEKAFQFCELLREDWKEAKKDYKALIYSKAEAVANKIHFSLKDEVQIRHEGKTIHITYPRIHGTSKYGINFDSRLCTAYCTGSRSTKNWSRVGIKYSQDMSHRLNLPLSKLKSLISLFRNIANSSSNWAFERMNEVLIGQFKKLKITLNGYLEIIAMGAKDQALNKYLEQLKYSNLTAKELLKIPEANHLIYKYFNKIPNISESVFKHKREIPYSRWFSSSVKVENSERKLEPHQVLYLMRSFDNTIQAVGLGYDNSRSGDLAQLSSLKVARWLGERI